MCVVANSWHPLHFLGFPTAARGLGSKLRGAPARLHGRLTTKALKVASTYSSVAERLADVVAELDVLCSLARVALTAPLWLQGGSGVAGANALRRKDESQMPL